MESLFIFLYSASVSIAVFFILYWALLRELTEFRVNRLFLLASLAVSLFIAAFPIHYEVAAPISEMPFLKPVAKRINDGKILENIPATDRNLSWTAIQITIYSTGVFFFLLRLIIQTVRILLVIYRSEAKKLDGFYIHENTEYNLPFSFFNHIFINPEFHKQNDLDDMLAHEKVHIRERHWIDLLFIELLTVLFWFNPFIWFFEHAIKQNHEFLADEGVLSLGYSPVRYQALLVNQLMGMQVIGLTNHLTFALGPNRLNMMTKQKTSKRKLLRIAWAVPLLAILLTAFAEPEYKKDTSGAQANVVTALKEAKETTIAGRVVNESGDPLYGATVVIRGTTTGTVTDEKGNFSLELSGSEGIEIVISYVGFQSIMAKVTPKKDYQWNFTMKREVIGIDTKNMSPDKELPVAPPPPPPPTPASVETKPNEPEGEVFFSVEEMPRYPGGIYELRQYVQKKQNELKADLPTLKGKAKVSFTIDEKGNITNVHVVYQTSDEAAKALTSIVEGMSNWSPGKQRGIAVPVDYEMQLEF
ncbi:MAG: carboxypeptidase-like regulatory domain-containing protein [Mangrovibacterium sp.]